VSVVRKFSAERWNELVADYAPPNALLVATADGIVGFTAVRVETGELFLLFVSMKEDELSMGVIGGG
jgi:hypothetical protein